MCPRRQNSKLGLTEREKGPRCRSGRTQTMASRDEGAACGFPKRLVWRRISAVEKKYRTGFAADRLRRKFNRSLFVRLLSAAVSLFRFGDLCLFCSDAVIVDFRPKIHRGDGRDTNRSLLLLLFIIYIYIRMIIVTS